MDLKQSFDLVEAIRHLDLELRTLRAQVAGLRQSATMDAPEQGAHDGKPYIGASINQRLHEAIWDAGYKSLQELRKASDEELLAIKGIGKDKLRKLRKALE